MLTAISATIATIAFAAFIAFLYKTFNAPATYGKMSTFRAMQKAYPEHCAFARQLDVHAAKNNRQ